MDASVAGLSHQSVNSDVKQALDRFEATLGDLSINERREALATAESLMTFLVEEEGRPPWGLDMETFARYGARVVARLVSSQSAEGSNPEYVLRLVDHWRSEGRVSPETASAIGELMTETLMNFDKRHTPAASGFQKSPDPDLPPPPIVSATRVGRNDPCPCGSGKKVKKCCGD